MLESYLHFLGKVSVSVFYRFINLFLYITKYPYYVKNMNILLVCPVLNFTYGYNLDPDHPPKRPVYSGIQSVTLIQWWQDLQEMGPSGIKLVRNCGPFLSLHFIDTMSQSTTSLAMCSHHNVLHCNKPWATRTTHHKPLKAQSKPESSSF